MSKEENIIEEEKYFFSDFKKNRESKNITIDDIVKKTKIQEKYINAIECGQFKDIPTVYTPLFLKSYCKAIELDEDETLKAYNDYIKGNRNTISTNKTPQFIENKNKLNDGFNIRNISNIDTSYFIQPQKLLSFIAILLIIIIVWITMAKISDNRYKNEIIFDNTKLNWKYLNELTFIDSEVITINSNDKNIIKYETVQNIKNKILITNNKSLDLENKILDKNEQGEEEFNTDITFGILNGNIHLLINGQKINFIYTDKIIVGDLKIKNDQLEISLSYFE